MLKSEARPPAKMPSSRSWDPRDDAIAAHVGAVRPFGDLLPTRYRGFDSCPYLTWTVPKPRRLDL
jgi:hypothetical protein